MNKELKSQIAASGRVGREFSADRAGKIGSARISMICFYVMTGSLFLFDALLGVKSLLVGTTWLGTALYWAALALELFYFLFLVFPKFQYNYTLHVGGQGLAVILFLPVLPPAADAAVFRGYTDFILLGARVLLWVAFLIVYLCTVGRREKLRNLLCFALIPVLAIVCAAGAFFVEQDISGFEDYGVRYTYAYNDDGTVEITGFGGVSLSRNYIIPETVNGKKVTALGPRFADRLKGASVLTLPESIERIAPGAFARNANIKEIVVMSSSFFDLDFIEGSAVACVGFPNGVNVASVYRETSSDLSAVRVKVPAEVFNDYRRTLFAQGLDNASLYPIEEVYYVNFNTNSDTYLDSAVASTEEEALSRAEETLKAPLSYRKDGREQRMVGWYLSPAFSADSAASGAELHTREGRLDLYLRWVPVYGISFEEGDWELDGAFTAEEFTELDPDLPLPSAHMGGYTFRGWYLDAEYGERVSEVDTSCGKDVKLYPKFLKNYSLRFHWGKAEEEEAPEYYLEDTDTELPRPSLAGYDFSGWFEDAAFGGEPRFSIEKGNTGDRDLYAKFTPIVYRVTFDPDKGAPVDAKEYNVEASDFDLPTCSRKGFEFAGWYSPSGELVSRWETNRMENVTLTAHWTLAAFEATLEENDVRATYGEGATLCLDFAADWFLGDGEVGYTYAWERERAGRWEPLGEASKSLSVKKVSDSGKYRILVTAHYRDAELAAQPGDGCVGTIVLSPKPVSLVWTAENLVYDKTPKLAVATVSNLEAGDTCEVTAAVSEGRDNVNAGLFTFAASALGNENYTLSEGEGLVSQQFRILPKPVSLAWTAPEDLVYNSREKTPSVRVIDLVNGDECAVFAAVTAGKSNVHAGSFTFTANRLGNGNYTLDGGKNVVSDEYVISPKAVVLSWSAPEDLVYNKKPKLAVATVSNLEGGDSCSVHVKGTVGTDNVNAGGSFTCTADGLGNGDYTLEGGVGLVSGRYSVTPKPAELAWRHSGSDVYDKKPKTLTASVTDLEAGDICAVSVRLTEGADNVNAGTFTFTAYELDNPNYTLGGEQVSTPATIRPKPVEIVWTAPSNLVYDGGHKNPTARVANLEEGDNCTVEASRTSNTFNIGVGTFSFTAKELNGVSKDNYTLSGGKGLTSETYTILPRPVELEWTPPENLVFDGSPKFPTARVTNLAISRQVCIVEVSLTDGCDNVSPGVFTFTATGLTGADSANYTLDGGKWLVSEPYTILAAGAFAPREETRSLPETALGAAITLGKKSFLL